jgi:hypothetical protein
MDGSNMMPEIEKDKKWLRETWNALPTEGQFLIRVISVVFTAALAAWIVNFGLLQAQPVSGDSSHWGQLGDFFGGILNPLIAVATLVGVWSAVKLQRTELNDTREVLKLQYLEMQEQGRVLRFQYSSAVFFQYIDTIRRAIDLMYSHVNNVKVSGEDNISTAVESFRDISRGTMEREGDFAESMVHSFQPIIGLLDGAIDYVHSTYSNEIEQEKLLVVLRGTLSSDLVFCIAQIGIDFDDSTARKVLRRGDLMKYYFHQSFRSAAYAM